MPSGYVQTDEQGRPYVLKIVKPIYGLPQAGRRFQRSIYPWLRSQGFCQLDDSDSSVWVHRPDGSCNNDIDVTPSGNMSSALEAAPSVKSCDAQMSEEVEAALAAYHASDVTEKLILGVYVDNLQIIHSHPIVYRAEGHSYTCIHEGCSERLASRG